MRLTTKSRYAVMAMAELASHLEPRSMPLSLLAELQELPLVYLEQIFFKLRRAGLVKSSRGVHGGYILGRSAEEISVFDVMVAVDQGVQTTRCYNIEKGCRLDGGSCQTHDLWDSLDNVIRNFLKNTTLYDVVTQKLRPAHPKCAKREDKDEHVIL